MHAAICDDEKENVEKLGSMVKSFFAGKEIALSFSVYKKGSSLLKSIEEGTVYDVIFMDINLVTEDGISIISEARKLGCTTPVIFVTGYENRAVDGYDVDAFAFVVKKNMDEKLPKVLAKLYTALYEKTTLAVETRDSVRILNTEEILFIESENRTSKVHTEKEELTDLRSITHFAGLLSADDFVEVHKSVYVNIPKIKRINADTVELEEGTVLPLSRRCRKLVMFAVMKRVSRI